jgi:2-(1,2-epoxy-1,2-dihydrophenyl)acetyl-CoA isomerase
MTEPPSMSESIEVEGLLVSRDGGVLVVTLNRPDTYNALDWRTREAFVAALGEASADVSVRAVVVTGAGDRAFCTGADLRSPMPMPAKPEGAPARVQGEVSRGISTGWQLMVTAVLDCEKPVVAAVNGVAAGAGMHLALASDVVVMSDAAKLVPVFVRRGIAPDAGGAYLTTRLVGPQRAKLIYLFGDDIPAAQALEWGLVTSLAPQSETLSSAMALAQRLATGPTRTLAITKRLVNRAMDQERQAALDEESWGQELVMTTEDAQEGVRAFIERRETEFRGW